MPTPISRLPRKQRKAAFSAHNFARRRFLTVALSKELRTRYGRRQLPVRKGDTVRVLSGSYEGQEERVAKIDTRGRTLTLDNITVKKADAKLKALPVRPNHLLLTKLNLADTWRRRVLKVGDEESAAAPVPVEGPNVATPAEEKAKPAVEEPPTPKRKPKASAAAAAKQEAPET
ncbi:MAG TPA: 50S ribosomal protein L24 [Thermoplasmata archaeon]|nr:50S ribosomal protein L24 [Thermoplasmata archaeon]